MTIDGVELRAAQERAREERQRLGIGVFPTAPPEFESPTNYSLPPLPDISEACVSRWLGVEPEPLEFAIRDLAPSGMTTLLVAEGGGGKSVFMQTAISCIAAGQLFVGKRCEPGGAAGIFVEDSERVLHLRQKRINTTLGIDEEALLGRAFVQSYAGFDTTLWGDSGPTDFAYELEHQLSKIENLRLVVLDNAALLFSGNENDRVQVTAFLNYLNGVAQRLGVAIILTTHQSKSTDGSTLRAASGSTAWVNGARSVLKLEKGEEEDTATLTLIKANHAKPGEEIPLVWRDGVLCPVRTETGIIAHIEKRNAETAFLDALDALEKQGRQVSASRAAQNYGPKVAKRMPQARRVKLQDLERAMENLFDEGAIVQEPYGPPSKGLQRIVRAGDS